MHKTMFRRLSPSMAVAVLALVLALGGSAIAAKKYLITSTKQISPPVLKKLKGANGHAGPAGLAGAVGPKGDPGPAGKDGASVTTKAIPTGDTRCNKLGGTEFTSTSGTEQICNGQTGFVKSLPKEATLTGVWGTSGGFSTTENVADESMVPFSYSTPLSSAPTIYIGKAATEPPLLQYVKFPPAESPAPITEAEFKAQCEGSVAGPLAKAGALCIYTELENASVDFATSALNLPSGAVVPFRVKAEHGYARGSWAVTAP